MAKLITVAVFIALAGFLASRVDMNIVLMRFFRDLARSKARKRLYGNQHALLIPMLLGTEDFILNKTDDDKFAEKDALTMTATELATYTGEDDDDSPLYICISGRIYDVTAGERFYGVDGKYHLFVGKDATRAYATGCLEDNDDCVTSSTDGLTETEFKEIDRWLELYETHDKYTFVGFLVDDPVDQLLEMEATEEGEEQQQEQEQ